MHRNSTVITVGIWDTAGQERFESISKLYYRGAKAALVCFDLTNKASFSKVKFWVEELKAYAPECLIFLVGTKADLVEAGVAREVNEAELNKVNAPARCTAGRTRRGGRGPVACRAVHHVAAERAAKPQAERGAGSVAARTATAEPSRCSVCRSAKRRGR